MSWSIERQAADKMTAPAKFLFDRRFNDPVEGISEKDVLEQELRSQYESQLRHMRERSFDEGRKEGQEEALNSLNAKISTALDKVIETISRSTRKTEELYASIRADALRIALIAADKLASGLLDQQPTAALEKLIDECIELASEAPHIAIRVNDALAELIRNRVDEAARHKGFAGKIIVIPDPELAIGDGQLDWADGGATRSHDDVRKRIDEAVCRYLEAQGIKPRGLSSGNGAAEPEQASLAVDTGISAASAEALGDLR